MDDIFQRTLRLSLPAVGIAFRDSPPDNVPHAAAGPASCTYWRRAADGDVFWTDAGDHQGCPIGAHTHGVQMNEAKRQELMGLVGTMVELGYVRMDEVQSIPQPSGEPGVHRQSRLHRARGRRGLRRDPGGSAAGGQLAAGTARARERGAGEVPPRSPVDRRSTGSPTP